MCLGESDNSPVSSVPTGKVSVKLNNSFSTGEGLSRFCSFVSPLRAPLALAVKSQLPQSFANATVSARPVTNPVPVHRSYGRRSMVGGATGEDGGVADEEDILPAHRRQAACRTGDTNPSPGTAGRPDW
jgi:hypothetical protein